MEGERTLIGWTPSNKLLVPSRRNLAAARKRPHYVAVLPLPPSPPQLFVNSWWTLCTDQWLSGSNRHRVRCRRIHRFNLMIGYRPDVVPIKSKRVRAGKLSAGRPVWQQKRRPASAAVNDADGWEGWGGGVALFSFAIFCCFFSCYRWGWTEIIRARGQWGPQLQKQRSRAGERPPEHRPRAAKSGGTALARNRRRWRTSGRPTDRSHSTTDRSYNSNFPLRARSCRTTSPIRGAS